MAVAVILFEGNVKQETNLSNTTFNNKSGFITSFVFNNKKYTHTLNINNDSDDKVSAGYYEEAQFLKYLVKTLLPADLVQYKLNVATIADAVKGDTIKVSKLKILYPYADFCKINSFTWAYDPAISVYDDITDSILVPDSATVNPVDVPLSATAYAFYDHNIDFITNSDFTDDRDSAAYALALTAIEIHRINTDIFPMFSSSTELSGYIATQNDEWATGVLFNKPGYDDFLQYEESIVNYYNAAYSNQLLIASAPLNMKVFWLANVLSASGLAVFPVDLKLTLLYQIVQTHIAKKTVSSSNPNYFLYNNGASLINNIVESVTVTPNQTFYFLSQLIIIKFNGLVSDTTLFEMLYNYLDDNNIGAITGGVINTNGGRKQFIQSLYNIWKTSIYYPKYNSPSYTQPANPKTGVFPESYFMTITGKTEYDQEKAPAALVYESYNTTLTSYTVNYSFKIENEKIIASQEIKDSINTERPSSDTNDTIYGTYGYYQPVSVMGYAQNFTIDGITQNCVPLFVLYYTYQYQFAQDVDFGVMTFVNLALNLTIFGEIGDLGYLIEISGIAEADTLAADTKILFWTKVLNVSKTVQFTARSFSAITNYIATATDDPRIQAYYAKLSLLLGLLAIGSICTDIKAQKYLITAAQDAAATAEELGDEATLSSQAKEEIAQLADIDENILSMQTKLEALARENVNSRFNSFTAQQKFAFFTDFYDQDDSSFWDRMNATYIGKDADGNPMTRIAVDDWEDIEKESVDKKDINVLESYARLKYIKPSEFDHFTTLFNKKTAPGFDPVGGHTSGYIANGEMMSITDPILPVERRTVPNDINGHTLYENLYIKKPPGAQGGLEYPPNSGVFYYRKALHGIINSDWEEQELLEEMSHALGKKNNPMVIIEAPLYNESDNLETTTYSSQFSDGTSLQIIHRNYDKDPLTGTVVFDHIAIVKIIKK